MTEWPQKKGRNDRACFIITLMLLLSSVLIPAMDRFVGVLLNFFDDC